MADSLDSMDSLPAADPETHFLDGLAKKWDADEIIRDRLLRHGSLLAWPNPKMQGVINFSTMAMNYRVIELLLQLWCPQMDQPKTVIIDQVREEVGNFWAKQNMFFGVVILFLDVFGFFPTPIRHPQNTSPSGCQGSSKALLSRRLHQSEL